MSFLVLGLIPLAAVISLVLCRLLIGAGHRLGTFDSAGVAGQVKAAPRRVPNTGGVAIFLAIAFPMAALLLLLVGVTVDANDFNLIPAELTEHLPGIAAKAPDAWRLLGALLALHVLGLLDDRRPLPALPKLAVMLGVSAAVAWLTETRLLTAIDAPVGGPWLSFVLTVVWLTVLTNALNFLDNMDGLSGGVALIAAGALLAAALWSAQPQWFVAGVLALLVGALLGFLFFNYPWRPSGAGAALFMGDSGSLLLGFLLAFLSVRVSYATIGGGGGPGGLDGPVGGGIGADGAGVGLGPAYAVLMPLVILAVPLYDFASVCIIRVRAGRSPFVGDLNHLSHRLVRRGLSRRQAVWVIHGLTGITAAGALLLASADRREAALVALQTGLVLALLALFESRARSHHPGASPTPPAMTPGADA